MESPFSRMVSGLVDRYTRQSGVSKKEVASRIGYSASAFSHFLTGRRAVRSRETVLALARALELDIIETNALLGAAGYSPTSEMETVLQQFTVEAIRQVLSSAELLLETPDKEVVRELIEADIRTVMEAWSRWIHARDDLYRRRWSLVLNQVKTSLEVEHGKPSPYWSLRSTSARFQAYSLLLEASADIHRGELNEASRAARAALTAAQTAKDVMAQCRAHVRLGDIYKVSGRFATSKDHYEKAFVTLAEQDGSISSKGVWVAQWKCRIIRKRGTLYLYQGLPHKALALLRDNIHDLETNVANNYELSRAYYSLGWAYSDLGNWNMALDSHNKGFKLTKALNEARRWSDQRQLMEGYLCLASDYLHLKEYELARHYLERSEELVGDKNALGWDGDSYHEIGRLYLLRGKLSTVTEGPQANSLARKFFKRGIDFHLNEKVNDPSRLASLYNALGELELQDGHISDAMKSFEHALQWAEASEPPNISYRSAALVNVVAAQLIHEESTVVLTNAIDEARNACLSGPYWQQASKLEGLLLWHCARHGAFVSAVEHAAESLSYATRYNEQAVDDCLDNITRSFDELGHEQSGQMAYSIIDRMDIIRPRIESGAVDYSGDEKILREVAKAKLRAISRR